MTPAEWEWQCEMIENEIEDLMRKHPDKVLQARQRPQLIGWFVGQAAKNLGGTENLALTACIANELILKPDGPGAHQ